MNADAPQAVSLTESKSLKTVDTRFLGHVPKVQQPTPPEELPSNAVAFRCPMLIASDDYGRLFVCENGNKRVQVINVNTYERVLIAGEGLLQNPVGIDVDSHGNMVVCDHTLRKVFMFDGSDGRLLHTVEDIFTRPVGVAIDRLGSQCIYIVDKEAHCIRVLDSEGNSLFQFGSRGSDEAMFIEPIDITIHHAQRQLYVSDRGNRRVQVFDLQGNFKRSIPVADASATGVCLAGIAVDRVGNIILPDYESHVLRVFDPDGTLIDQVGRSGAEVGEFTRPYGVAIDVSGRILVSEQGNHRLTELRGWTAPKWEPSSHHLCPKELQEVVTMLMLVNRLGIDVCLRDNKKEEELATVASWCDLPREVLYLIFDELYTAMLRRDPISAK